jgi:hypothetical protein
MSLIKPAYPLDLRAPGAIEQLIAFHHATFGDSRMDGDDGGDGGAGGSDGGGDGGAGDGGSGNGFPADTPIAEMTPEEQAAYWKHAAQKHEQRNKEWRNVLGGKTSDEVKAELAEADRLRQEQMSDHEKALAEAVKKGRESALSEYGPKMARLAFDAALSHLDKDKRDALLDTLDLSKVITTEGTIDTDKVSAIVSALAPADTANNGGGTDYGAGRRQTKSKSGVDAGADLFAGRKKSSPTNDS